MSSVNTVTIQMSEYGTRRDVILEALNKYLEENSQLGGKFEFLDGQKSAGRKSPERSLLWGGMNYLNIEEFIELFKSLKIEDGLLTISNSDYGHYYVVHTGCEVEIRQ